jgi:hypothetical protein
MQLPLRRKDTKVHKELIFNNIHFVYGEALNEVKLSALVPWWHKKTFRIGLKN